MPPREKKPGFWTNSAPLMGAPETMASVFWVEITNPGAESQVPNPFTTTRSANT